MLRYIYAKRDLINFVKILTKYIYKKLHLIVDSRKYFINLTAKKKECSR